MRGAVGQTRGSYPGVGICRASLGPDQEDEEALSCPAPAEVPQGHPNKQRQLEHSVAKVPGKERGCSGESRWLPPSGTGSFAYPAGCGRSAGADTEGAAQLTGFPGTRLI